MALLNIEDIRIEFPSRRGTLVAVDGVSLSLEKGEILGVVGESGAGKSTIGNAVIGLLEAPGRLAGGSVLLNGERIDTLTPAQKRKVRGRRIGMIFQDPLTSLDPLQTVESQLVETMQVHLNLSHAEAKKRAVQLLVQVGIDQPELRVQQYPHQFSGGMRQRVVIALALCCEPEVIIADEPTTALDVSIQAQILELLKKLCREEQVGMIIITHDMGVIADVTDRVAVLYHGKLVEQGPTAKILGDPDHPYTRSLISAVPAPGHQAQALSAGHLHRRREDAVAAPGSCHALAGPTARLRRAYRRSAGAGARPIHALRVEERAVQTQPAHAGRGQARELLDRRRRGLRAGGRIGFRQIHRGAADLGAVHALGRFRHVRAAQT